MDSMYRNIYRELLALYRVSHPSYFPFGNYASLALADEAIDDAVAALPKGVKLRADARLFLLVNLHQLVVLPISDSRSPTEFTQDLEEGVKSDVRKILQASYEFSRREVHDNESEEREISAAQVVFGLAQRLNELNLKSWRIWDGDE